MERERERERERKKEREKQRERERKGILCDYLKFTSSKTATGKEQVSSKPSATPVVCERVYYVG